MQSQLWLKENAKAAGKEKEKQQKKGRSRGEREALCLTQASAHPSQLAQQAGPHPPGPSLSPFPCSTDRGRAPARRRRTTSPSTGGDKAAPTPPTRPLAPFLSLFSRPRARSAPPLLQIRGPSTVARPPSLSRPPAAPRPLTLTVSSLVVLSIDRWPQLELGSTEAPDPFRPRLRSSPPFFVSGAVSAATKPPRATMRAAR